MKKKIFAIIFMCLAALTLASCNKNKTIDDSKVITVSFEGAESMELEKGSEINLPEIDLSVGEELLGWALRKDETQALFQDTLTYSEASDYSTNGSLKLYPVLDYSIEVTIKGVTDVKTTVTKIRNNNANLPLVEQSERQKFLGWGTSENAKVAELSTSAIINYSQVKDLAQNAKVTLYPVIENYDIMICVHGSHSNGNIYVSDSQRAELKALLEEKFEGKNILIDYVDLANASTFASEAIKKDYDIVLASKSAREQAGDVHGDISTAALNANKPYYAEADANETVLSLIDLNQSRQVCKFLGGTNEKPYQNELYTFLTTPMDQTVTIKFVNGTEEETIEAHRVVDGVLSNVAYEPTNSEIMKKAGFVFDGWALTENATEVSFPNATYQNAKSVATNGEVTLYPVFVSEPDAYILVWGMNGTNEYVSEEQFNAIQALFEAYLEAHSISKEGKNVELVYFIGKTDEFKAELTKGYLCAAVGAAALNNSDYASYWTYNPNYYAKVINATTTNTSRYVALRDGAETNEFAVAFFNSLCEAELNVVFKYGEVTSEAQKVNSVAKNEATLPETITAPSGSFLLGYALEKDATEPTITGAINYANISGYAVDSTVTLYPVFGKYDLVVYVWCGQSKTGTTYVAEEEVEALKNSFITSLGDKATDKTIVFYPVWGKTAEYAALVGSDADVIISGTNLNTEAQCGALLIEQYARLEVLNYTFASGSTRYAGLCTKAETNELAIELLTQLCEATLTVTFSGTEAQTLNKVFNKNELVVPTVTLSEGQTFVGWATTLNAELAEFTDEFTYTLLSAKATNGAITLYPVITTEEVKEPILTVAILQGTASTKNITDEEVESIKAAFLQLLVNKGIEEPLVEWIVNPGATGAAFNATLTNKVDVVVGASNLTTQTGFPGMYEGETWTKITSSLIANTSRYVGIVATCDNCELAKEFVCLMAQETVTVTFNGGEPQTLTKLYNKAELVIPTVTPETGYEFSGWATTENASTVEFVNSGLTFDTLLSKATSGAIVLYPVFTKVAEEETKHYTVNIAYHSCGSSASTTYVTEAMLQKIKTLIVNALTEAGYTSDQYTINYVEVTGKVADAATAVKNSTNTIDIALLHTQCFDSTKATDYFVTADGYDGTIFTNKTEGSDYYCASNLKVGLGNGSETNPVAVIIYNTIKAIQTA